MIKQRSCSYHESLSNEKPQAFSDPTKGLAVIKDDNFRKIMEAFSPPHKLLFVNQVVVVVVVCC